MFGRICYRICLVEYLMLNLHIKNLHFLNQNVYLFSRFCYTQVNIMSLLHRQIKVKPGKCWYNMMIILPRTMDNNVMIGHCNISDQIQSKVSCAQLWQTVNPFMHSPTGPLMLAMHLSAISISIREPIVKVLAQIHWETQKQKRLPPHQRTNTHRAVLSTHHTAQKNNYSHPLRANMLSKGERKRMIQTIKSLPPAEMFYQPWGHFSEDSCLKQEVLSKSVQ